MMIESKRYRERDEGEGGCVNWVWRLLMHEFHAIWGGRHAEGKADLDRPCSTITVHPLEELRASKQKEC